MLACGLLAAPLAHAGTVSFSDGQIQYSALSGEQNHLTVTYAKQQGPAGITGVTLRDEGAPVIIPTFPGEFGMCFYVGPNEANCYQYNGTPNVRASLGDQDDYARIVDGYGQLLGGAGNDKLYGGKATTGDSLQGGPGDDLLDGGRGLGDQVAYNDRGSSSPVTVNLQTGTGGAAGETDTLVGFEKIIGGGGADTLQAGDTAPEYDVSGGGGNDTILGGATRVVAWGGGGNDTIPGGAGDDQLEGGAGGDVIGGSAGRDMANYYARQLPVDISIDGAANDGELNEGDDVRPEIDWILAGHNHDKVDAGGAAGPVYIEGRSGNDVLTGGGFEDVIEGGKESDTINGGGGDDLLRGEAPADTRASGGDDISGGAGVDTYESLDDDPARVGTAGATIDLDDVADDGFPDENDNIHSDVENVAGSKNADTLTGSGDANVLNGNAGDDMVFGGAGTDTLRGADGNDILDGQADADTIECGAGLDVVVPDLLDTLSGDCEI